MKKKILFFTLAGSMLCAALMSNQSGAGTGTGGNRSGADGSTANCGGGGCHGGESATVTASIRVDSGLAASPVAVNQYVAGMTYTVTVTGSHSSLSKFGFQLAAVSGTGSSQVQAGTYGSMPASVATHTLTGSSPSLAVVEQTTAITGPLSKSFTWTAPAAGVGTVTMYLAVNAVNGDGGATTADLSHSVSKTLTHYVPTSVADVASRIAVKAFPNPVMGQLNIQTGNAYSQYSLQVSDITGRNIINSQVEANVTGTTSINTTDWAPGLYRVVVANADSREVIQVVKQ